MEGLLQSASQVRRASLRAVIVVALLLAGQFFSLSHSVDHDSGRSDCVVCRVTNPYKQATVSLNAGDAIAPTGSIDALFVQEPPSLKLIACDIRRTRAPPTPA